MSSVGPLCSAIVKKSLILGKFVFLWGAQAFHNLCSGTPARAYCTLVRLWKAQFRSFHDFSVFWQGLTAGPNCPNILFVPICTTFLSVLYCQFLRNTSPTEAESFLPISDMFNSPTDQSYVSSLLWMDKACAWNQSEYSAPLMARTLLRGMVSTLQ